MAKAGGHAARVDEIASTTATVGTIIDVFEAIVERRGGRHSRAFCARRFGEAVVANSS